MAFIRTVPPDKADGVLSEIYQEDLKTKGFVANHTSAFSLRPEVYKAWQNLLRVRPQTRYLDLLETYR